MVYNNQANKLFGTKNKNAAIELLINLFFYYFCHHALVSMDTFISVPKTCIQHNYTSYEKQGNTFLVPLHA